MLESVGSIRVRQVHQHSKRFRISYECIEAVLETKQQDSGATDNPHRVNSRIMREKAVGQSPNQAGD